jgi:hypothetical protein
MIYQIKVTLRGSHPPIWRRLQVPGWTNLNQLHWIIQFSMGWTNSHLHQFIVGGQYFSEPSPFDFEPVVDERKFKLCQVAPVEKFKFIYEYDFGDSWEHVILVEKIMPPEKGVHYPRCIKGKRACPPEDVGGVWGYEEMLAALKDPSHPEHEMYMEWIGDDFDPEDFDLEEANEGLETMKI